LKLPKLDAKVIAHVPGPFQIRSREIEADVRGQFDVIVSDGKPRLYGYGEATWGRVELFGRHYQLERARIDFGGQAEPNPTVDIKLTREITGTTIVVEVHGTAKKPQLVLASDPPIYDSSQIIGILLSGDPGHAGVPDDRRGALGATQDTLAGAISNLLVHKITDQLMPGLPFEVRVETGRMGRIEIGHQLTDRIHLRYAHQFGDNASSITPVNANEAAVQVRFRRRASLTVRYGDAGVGLIDLSWMLRF
jgi:hypothetical protein